MNNQNIFINFYENLINILESIKNNDISKFFNKTTYIYKEPEINEIYVNDILIFTIGGSAYYLYNNIFIENGIENSSYKIDTFDYDISMSLKNNADYLLITNEIKKIINKEINLIQNKKNINLKLQTPRINEDRIQFQIENEKNLHILDLVLWKNGKISDLFTLNDFDRNNIIIYKNLKNQLYYLLPLQLLLKTTLYAITYFFETNNFNKCNKYLNRVKTIRNVYKYLDKIKNKNNSHNFLYEYIFNSYIKKVDRKYKMINDYPFTLSPLFNNLKNKSYMLCIYQKFRGNNKINIKKFMEKYNRECEKNNNIDSED
jgi:hypothetical protein